MSDTLAPIHPGSVLLDEFLSPLGISQRSLAQRIRVPATRVNEIARGRRAVTADTALRLARFFGTSAGFWLALQNRYDLDVAEDDLGDRLAAEVQPYSQAAS